MRRWMVILLAVALALAAAGCAAPEPKEPERVELPQSTEPIPDGLSGAPFKLGENTYAFWRILRYPPDGDTTKYVIQVLQKEEAIPVTVIIGADGASSLKSLVRMEIGVPSEPMQPASGTDFSKTEEVPGYALVMNSAFLISTGQALPESAVLFLADSQTGLHIQGETLLLSGAIMIDAGSDASLAPEAEPFAPEDIFGSPFNPYGGADFPDSFTPYAASFIKGAAKLEGRNPFVLSMTAGGAEEAIAFLAGLAELGEDETAGRIAAYHDSGFCEFQSEDGVVFAIGKTDPNDRQYAYVDGCHIELRIDVSAADMEPYTAFVRDNYNLNALAPISEYLDIEPDFAQYAFYINLHTKEAGVSVTYHIPDAAAVMQNIAAHVESDRYDAENGTMRLTYGAIALDLAVDPRGEGFNIDQTIVAFDTALSEYAAPEVSLTKLGFGFDSEDVCGVYAQKDPHYIEIAIHRPEWGEHPDDWNIEHMDEVNGYGLMITYHADEGKYRISLSKNGTRGVFCYFPATGEYVDEYPDSDTIRQVFNDAYGTQGEDFYDQPMARFEALVQELFGMSIDALYALPIR